MISYDLKTSVKISLNIDETYVLTPSLITNLSPLSMQISTRRAKMITKKNGQFNLYNASPKPLEKTQKPVNIMQQRANANLIIIVNLVEI